MSVIYMSKGEKHFIKEPYVIALLPEYTIVQIGEKESMEKRYNEIIEKIKSYDDEPKNDFLTRQVIQMLRNHNYDIPYPTVEDVKSLMQDYILTSIPNNQEEFDKILNITGYLKKYFIQ